MREGMGMKKEQMFKQNISYETWGGENGKYRLKNRLGESLEETPFDTCKRVSKSLADIEKSDKEYWNKQFNSIMGTKFAGGGRVMANAGATEHKKETSPINCTVMRQIPDSMAGIMDVAKEAAITLKAGCGVGYDFSPIRPKGAYVYGAGAETSGVISFMKIFDSVCSTVMSGGSRRGAQMACLDISSPDIEEFITAKRQDGVLRYFNCSVLITDKFMQAVEEDKDWDLWFWSKNYDQLDMENIEIKNIRKDDIPYSHPQFSYFRYEKDHNEVVYGNCTTKDIFVKKVYKTVKAKYLFDLITKSTYNFWEPGFILIDRVNIENNLYFCETIRCTNPCGEQPLHPLTSCLLGSMILPPYVNNAFETNSSFDFDQLAKDVRIATRALDNVVEINNLPLKEMQEEILSKRRHGLGFTGLGSVLNMLCIPYGSEESLQFSEKIMLIIAQQGLLENIDLAKEKGSAPIFSTEKNRKLVLESAYLKRLLNTFDNKNELVQNILKYGLRFSHATSIAPTGTMSLSWGNNCSNGIEPVFANSYMRNVRLAGKKTKTQEEVFDYAFFLWKEKFGNKPIPKYWRTTDDLKVMDHLKIQSVVQKWCDSSISKTINIPEDYSFEDFQKVYLDGWKLGLKGLTTYRPNPNVSSGVLTQKETLEKTEYRFKLEDGTEVSFKGTDSVEYDGEVHNVANLFDALKEGIYGNM
jgi:ribonucleoside-diphosphate reductase alpha chain